MALNPCVRQVLCGLSKAVQNALAGVIRGYVGVLTGYLQTLRAKLEVLNVLTKGPSIANTIVQAAVAEVRAGSNLIPLSLIGTCVPIGNLNAAIQSNLDLVLSDAQVISNDLARLLSLADEVNAIISDVEEVIQLYNEVLAVLDVCPTEAL